MKLDSVKKKPMLTAVVLIYICQNLKATSYLLSLLLIKKKKKRRKKTYFVQIWHNELEQRNGKSPERVQIPPRVAELITHSRKNRSIKG